MSEVYDDEHSSAIKTPKQLITVVLLAFLIPISFFLLVIQFITGGLKVQTDTSLMSPAAVSARLKPVGEVVLADSSEAAGSQSGEQIVKAVCTVCHGAGLLNAPKIGDTAAWKPRIGQGEKTLIAHAISGIRSMPPRGGSANLKDDEVARAVVWMANQSGAKLKEPAVAAPTAAPATSAPATSTSATSKSPGSTPAASTPATVAAPAVSSAPTSIAANASAPVPVTPAPVTATSGAKPDGAKTYQAVCSMCHAAGLMNAPKLGDKAAWKPRLAQGAATLHEHAIKGVRLMPAKGGNPALSDAEVSAAVDYMASQGK
ncbi:MAG: c-type cytochrome [Betaproteobacteria bacterium]